MDKVVVLDAYGSLCEFMDLCARIQTLSMSALAFEDKILSAEDVC